MPPARKSSGFKWPDMFLVFIWLIIIGMVTVFAYTQTPYGRRQISHSLTTSYAIQSPIVEWDETFSTGGMESVDPADRIIRPGKINYYLPDGHYLQVTKTVHVMLQRLNLNEVRFTFFRTVNGRYKPYKAGEETGVWLIPDDAVSASAGAETQGQQVASYILSLSPPAAADAPDTKTANGKAASSTDTALPDFIKPELQVMRVSNMTIGSLKRYSLTSDTPFAGSQYRLNQGIYSGTVTAHAKDWNYMLDNSRLELSRETLDFGDVLHVADYPGLHSSITGSINLIPNSTLLEINVNASNATTTISRDDGSVTGNYNITPSDWKTFSSLPTIQYLWVFLMTIATLLSFVRPKEG